MKKDIRKSIVAEDATLRDVLGRLNAGVFGVVFVAAPDGRVSGMFTDGDVRRALLAGAELSSPATGHMNREFAYALQGQGREEQLKKMTRSIRHLPILDDAGRLVDFISWAELWQLPVMEPFLGGNELKYVTDCITSNWISSQGSYVKNFEQEFARRFEVPHALTTSNGTTALHLALLGLGIGPGDEVLVPDATFAATANAVVHCGAEPVFVDVTPEGWTMDPGLLEAAITPRTRALIPVHLYGRACDMDPIMATARRHGLAVVEDCAEALGARYKGRPVGGIGDVGCFSFFSNKIITTGEGGMVVASDPGLCDRMRVLRDHGMAPGRRYVHEVVGYNYRMTNIQAALGLAQLEQLDGFLGLRRDMAGRYEARLAGAPGIVLRRSEDWAEDVCWLFTVLLDGMDAAGRDAVMARLKVEGIETRPFFPALHDQPVFRTGGGGFPVSSSLAATGLSLPSSYGMAEGTIDFICDRLKRAVASQEAMGCLEKTA